MRKPFFRYIFLLFIPVLVHSSVFQSLREQWIVYPDNSTHKYESELPVFVNANTYKEIRLLKKFSVADSVKSKNLRIHFSGIYGACSISLNSSLIKEYENYSSPFYVDVANPLLKDSDNLLEINIKAQSLPQQALPSLENYFRGEKVIGAKADITAEWLGPMFIENFSAFSKTGTAAFSYLINISDPKLKSANFLITEEIYDTSNKVIYRKLSNLTFSGMQRRVERDLEIEPAYFWDVENPQLLRLKIKITQLNQTFCTFETKFGFKNPEKDQHLYFSGITYRPPFDIKNKVLRDDLINIKNLGFNSILLPEYIPGYFLLALTDSLGMLVFTDMGITRFPATMFKSDQLLQNSKKFADDFLQTYSHHPSLYALGIGNQVDISENNVSKFYLILNEYLNQKYQIFTYFSLIDFDAFPQKKIADIYFIPLYGKNIFSLSEQSIPSGQAFVISKIGFPAQSRDDKRSESIQVDKFKKAFTNLNEFNAESGFFIESYRDWLCDTPTIVSEQNEKSEFYYPFGLVKLNNEQRLIASHFPKILSSGEKELWTGQILDRNNFFSITIFVSILLFFAFYKRNYKFRESFRRSLRHPYGFFVDIRDGRIISIINALVLQIFVLAILSVFFAAFFYAYKESILLDEIISIFLRNPGLKSVYLESLNSAANLFVIFWLFLFLFQILSVLIIKIYGLFSKHKVRLKQSMATIVWAGAPVIVFSPFSLIAYTSFINDFYQTYLFGILLFFMLWYQFRLVNGVRVLFMIRPLKMIMWMIITYIFIMIILYFVFDLNGLSIRYLGLLLFKANSLY